MLTQPATLQASCQFEDFSENASIYWEKCTYYLQTTI